MWNDASDVHARIKKYRTRAKKVFGQHFLVAPRIYRAIVDATVKRSSDAVIEIGAGLGTLTERLATRAVEGRIVAIEVDRDLVAILQQELGHFDNIEIRECDVLQYDFSFAARAAGGSIVVCGNLPYNISSQILIALTQEEVRGYMERGVFLLQKEMAERLLAKPGSKTYGILGVLIGAFCEGRKIIKVPPGAFLPPPKVDSMVIELVPRQLDVAMADEELFRDVVRTAFSQRRKTIFNCMKEKFSPERLYVAFASAKVEKSQRAETLAVEQFVQISNSLAESIEK